MKNSGKLKNLEGYLNVSIILMAIHKFHFIVIEIQKKNVRRVSINFLFIDPLNFVVKKELCWNINYVKTH